MIEQNRRVLICDDDPEMRHLLVATLRHKPLQIDLAHDGASALALLRENRYTVVLLDLMMPGIDGFGVLDAIDHETNPPVVLVVSGAGRTLLDRLDSRKIHGVVKKPFDPIELAEVVASCAELRGRGTFETMAMATMVAGAPLIALLRL